MRVELTPDRRATANSPVRRALVKAEQADLLSALAVNEGISLQRAAAVLAVLLHRHTQQAELPLQLVESAATHAGQRRLVTAQLGEDTRFSELLAQLSQPSADSLNANGSSSVEFHLIHDVAVETYVQSLRTDSRELTWLLTRDGQLWLEYDARLYEAPRMRELLAQFALLAHGLAGAPGTSIFEHSLVTPAALAVLPTVHAPIERPTHPLLTEAFDDWAAREPNNAAIRHGGRSYSYRELAGYAGQLACSIAARVQPGDVVAVTGTRGFALVAAMLGVLRSGAVLLTLDPKLPCERRRTMATQARAKLLLLVETDEGLEGFPALVVDASWDGIAGAPLPALDPNSQAYLFYTSGSTGTPKAVRGTQRGLAHFLSWQRGEFQIGPGDRASQLTALSFDVVLRDMFCALTSGAILCIPCEADVLEPAKILRWMDDEQITTVHVVPSLMRLWLNHVPDGVKLRALRRIFFAGEPLTDVLIARFREVFGTQPTVVNLYGPTETTLAKCFYRVPAAPSQGIQPIGRPMPQTQVLILNRLRGLCGLHEVGEIAIRTPFRSAGYLDNPEANAKAFIVNPFSGDADDLVYLSGDSGRYRGDGSLEILGRIDNQVKIRGVRIEPGEIEATLARSEWVREAAVVAREDGAGGKMLVAYVVPKNGQIEPAGNTIRELRTFLRARLPDTMVPSAFVLLAALPLNANGKLDRKALPAAERGSQGTPQAAPRTPRERELAVAWQEALAIDLVGVNESFYDLGGDSLTAIRVMLRMRALGIDEAVCRGLLQGRTIAELAAHADGEEIDPAMQAQSASREQMRLLLNVLKGALVSLIIFNHFTPSLGRRIPLLHANERFFEPLFNWGTPGFAFAFGITLGFVYLPQYRDEPARALTLLKRGATIVGVSAAFFSLVRVVMASLFADEHDVNPLAHAPLYYFFALCTAGLWMRVIASARKPLQATLGLAALSALLQFGLQQLVGHDALPGPGAILLGKYGYFGMSTGALLGLAVGEELRRTMAVPRSFVKLGALALLLGFALSLREPVASAWFAESQAQTPWRWCFYGGFSLLVLAALEQLLARVPRHGPLQTAVRVGSVIGQLSLPLFLLHYFARDLGNLCTVLGLPQTVRFAVEFGVLALITFVMAQKTYAMFYGAPTPSTPARRNSVLPEPARDSIV